MIVTNRFKYYLILYNISNRMEDKLITKVWVNKSNKQKLITIPKKSKIKCGDYVEIKKIEWYLKN